jgi:exodeoxyribonuclease VII small subunit
MSAGKSRSKSGGAATAAPQVREGGEASFEQEIEELERIVDELEHGSLALEDSLARFERGMQLSKQLETRLRTAEARVRKWMESGEATTAGPKRTVEETLGDEEQDQSRGGDGGLF